MTDTIGALVIVSVVGMLNTLAAVLVTFYVCWRCLRPGDPIIERAIELDLLPENTDDNQEPDDDGTGDMDDEFDELR